MKLGLNLIPQKLPYTFAKFLPVVLPFLLLLFSFFFLLVFNCGLSMVLFFLVILQQTLPHSLCYVIFMFSVSQNEALDYDSFLKSSEKVLDFLMAS